MIKRSRAIVDRHRKRQTARNQILLGKIPASKKFHSKRYDEHMAAIKEGCSEDASRNTFRVLIENYEDFYYFSMDKD